MKISQLGKLEKEAFSSTIIPGIYSVNLSAPIAVQYEISSKCNQDCVFCYNVWKEKKGSHQTTLALSQQFEVIEKLIKLKVFEVIFSGGEPLLIPEIHKLISKLRDANIRTSLITNGKLLTEPLLYNLKEAGLDGIQISIHASNPDLYDAIVRTSGSFFKTINGIKNAVRIFKPETINANMALISQNYYEVKPLMEFLSNLGVVSFSLGFLTKTGNALSKRISVTKSQVLEAFRTMIKISRETGLEVGISGGFPICIFPQEEQKEAINMAANLCDAGLNQLVIASNGDIRPCVCLPQKLGNILQDDPSEIWHDSPFLHFLRRLEHVPPHCHNCQLVAECKGGCRAAAYCAYHNFKEIDPIIEEEVLCRKNLQQ